MRKTVAIDCFPESVPHHRHRDAIVAIDVIRATTTATTAVALGRQCYPVPSIDAAVPLAARLHDPLLMGELGGAMPFGFHLNNSPADLEGRTDTHRPAILLSTSGTRVICGGAPDQAMYVACLRNFRATAHMVAQEHSSIALIGAGSRAEFRDEDQMCCAWLGELLMAAGFEPADLQTRNVVEHWHGAPVESLLTGASAKYLILSGQIRDLDFVLTHIDDLQEVYCFDGEQIVKRERVSALPAA